MAGDAVYVTSGPPGGPVYTFEAVVKWAVFNTETMREEFRCEWFQPSPVFGPSRHTVLSGDHLRFADFGRHELKLVYLKPPAAPHLADLSRLADDATFQGLLRGNEDRRDKLRRNALDDYAEETLNAYGYAAYRRTLLAWKQPVLLRAKTEHAAGLGMDLTRPVMPSGQPLRCKVARYLVRGKPAEWGMDLLPWTTAFNHTYYMFKPSVFPLMLMTARWMDAERLSFPEGA